RDFNPDVALTVQQQVDKLIIQATSLENLCQCFSGWYVQLLEPLWRFTDRDVNIGVRSGRPLLEFRLRFLSVTK
ncbi:hypothetical protein BC629DRAFT_1276407, partial [Irpex lacteus]